MSMPRANDISDTSRILLLMIGFCNFNTVVISSKKYSITSQANVVFMARYLQLKLRAFFILGTFEGFANDQETDL